LTSDAIQPVGFGLSGLTSMKYGVDTSSAAPKRLRPPTTYCL
jgi:hypothetical protein